MLEFIKQNLAALIGGLIVFVGIIVRLTPTKVDDKIFSIITKLYYLLFPNKKKSD